MIKKIVLPVCVSICYLILTSCGAGKQIVMTNYQKYQTNIDSLTIAALDPIIQKNDILSVNISVAGSKTAQDLASIYNGPNSNNLNAQGYIVSPKNGCINIVSIGLIPVAGKSKQEAAELIVEKLKGKLLDPIVTIRITNFRVIIEGEIGRPGPIEVTNEVITLQQAIGLAGGTTLYATLNDVQIIRNDYNGQKLAHIDLRKDEIYTTKKEYFYLKQGDLIMIGANREKIASTNQSTSRTIGYASTALSILLAMFTIFGQRN